MAATDHFILPVNAVQELGGRLNRRPGPLSGGRRLGGRGRRPVRCDDQRAENVKFAGPAPVLPVAVLADVAAATLLCRPCSQMPLLLAQALLLAVLAGHGIVKYRPVPVPGGSQDKHEMNTEACLTHYMRVVLSGLS